MQRFERPLTFLAALVVGVLYFVVKAGDNFYGQWSHDDLMNTYRALTITWPELLWDNVTVWKATPMYRPFGQVIYRLFFERWGFDQFPFRILISAALIGNAFLLGHIAYRLSRNLQYGLAATAIFLFHPLWAHLYFNTGTCYEILAFTLGYAVFAIYVEACHRGWERKWWVLAAMMLLWILALDTKESAITIPVLIGLYDLIWHRRINWALGAASMAVGIPFIVGRVMGPGGIATVGLYHVTPSLGLYLERFNHYFSAYLTYPGQTPLWLGLAAMAAAFASRKRELVLGAAIWMIGLLPLAFVAERGLDGVYIACAGLALLAAYPFTLAWPKLDWQRWGLVLLVLACFRYMPATHDIHAWGKEYDQIRDFRVGLLKAMPALPKGAQIRVLDDPFPTDYNWASTFIATLAYRDLSLVLVSAKNPHTREYPAEKDFAVVQWDEAFRSFTRLK